MLECGRQGYKNLCCNRRPAFQNGFPGRGREGGLLGGDRRRMWEVLSPSLWNTPLKKRSMVSATATDIFAMFAAMIRPLAGGFPE